MHTKKCWRRRYARCARWTGDGCRRSRTDLRRAACSCPGRPPSAHLRHTHSSPPGNVAVRGVWSPQQHPRRTCPPSGPAWASSRRTKPLLKVRRHSWGRPRPDDGVARRMMRGTGVRQAPSHPCAFGAKPRRLQGSSLVMVRMFVWSQHVGGSR